MASRPEPCIHSVTVPDCPSCWKGNYERMVREYLKLREIVLASDDAPLIAIMADHEVQRFGGNTPDKWEPKGHGTERVEHVEHMWRCSDGHLYTSPRCGFGQPHLPVTVTTTTIVEEVSGHGT